MEPLALRFPSITSMVGINDGNAKAPSHNGWGLFTVTVRRRRYTFLLVCRALQHLVVRKSRDLQGYQESEFL